MQWITGFSLFTTGGRVRAAGPAGEDLSRPTVQGFHRYPLTPLEIAEFDGALTRSAEILTKLVQQNSGWDARRATPARRGVTAVPYQPRLEDKLMKGNEQVGNEQSDR